MMISIIYIYMSSLLGTHAYHAFAHYHRLSHKTILLKIDKGSFGKTELVKNMLQFYYYNNTLHSKQHRLKKFKNVE